jgi:SAM-dependent methyltransferase
VADDRYRLLYRLRYAARNPGRILPYLRRWWRDRRIARGHRDHVSYYREVMRHDVQESPDRAVGSHSRARWLAVGQMQFDHLVARGLRPDHDLLEVGCGNLRAGWRLIAYLEPHRYTGIDISPDILLAANTTIEERGLQDREPQLRLVDDLRFGWCPDDRFDLVHAHSVFSHCPWEVIEECLDHVGRILRPGGVFDFSFNETRDREHHVLREDYYYRAVRLSDAAERRGFTAELVRDWAPGHRQSRMRLTAPTGPVTATGD